MDSTSPPVNLAILLISENPPHFCTASFLTRPKSSSSFATHPARRQGYLNLIKTTALPLAPFSSLVAVFPGCMGGFLGHQKMAVSKLARIPKATMARLIEQRDGLDDFALRVDHQQPPLTSGSDQRVAIEESLTGPNLPSR